MHHEKNSENEDMDKQSYILIIIGISMVIFSAASLFSVSTHETLLTSFVVLGSTLVVAGCFLPRMGGDFEIGPKGIKGKLNQLDDEVSVAENQIPQTKVAKEEGKVSQKSNPSLVEEVLTLATTSPAAALLLLSRHIEYETKSLLSTTGWLPESRTMTFTTMLQELESRKLLPASLLSSVGHFREIRNSVTHASKTINENEILAAIENGLSILKMIQAIPRENHHVLNANITLYSDSGAKQSIDGVKGVILNNTSPSSLGSRKSIFPTTRNDYEPGQQLGWQWNLNRVYPKMWYRDPDNSKIKPAWESSCEFNGDIIPSV